MRARAEPGRALPGQLLSVARDELFSALVRAETAVRLASPFLSEEVATAAIAEARAGRANTLRLLTAVTHRSVVTGVLSARGLRLLLDANWEIRSVPNLHAKLALVDRAWGLIGSGNLTGFGIGRPGAAAGNIELGVVLSRRQVAAAIRTYDGWWADPRAGKVTPKNLAPFIELEPRRAGQRTRGREIGRAIALPATAAVRRRRLDPGTGLWAKAMYHRDPGLGEWWMDRTWIHDVHWARSDGSITHRPGYQVGDRIVLYVVEPQRCPAVYVVTGKPEDRRDLVRAMFGNEDAERYGWVTPVEVLAAVPLAQAPGLAGLGVHPQSLQNGYVRIRDRSGYQRLERHLRR